MTKRLPPSRHRPAIPRGQDGFTLIITLLVLLITSLLLVAAFTAANGEVHLTATDTAQKRAYYAAEAGVENYEYHLTQDGNYLTFCTTPTPANPALNQAGASPLKKAEVPSTNGEPTHEQYAIQLLPAESSAEKKCNTSNVVGTMVEDSGPATGTFRIESTGYSEGAERTLVATFKNANFVSYVWYTKYETGDPVIYGTPPEGKEKYFIECGQFYGKRPAQGGSPERCDNNFFISGESVNGPLHTSDHGGVCGSPVFGRNEHDRIEFGNGGSTTGEGYSNEGCGKTATPEFKGTYIPPKEVLSIEPPPGDEELKHIVEPKYLYEGKTEIILEGEKLTVIKHKDAGITNGEVEEKGLEYPPNGVIYVAGGCSESYSPFGPKPTYSSSEPGNTDTACGNVYVHGKYEDSLTIAAENDVIINGNVLTPTEPEDSPTGVPKTNALLGLIANNFVRVYHPVVRTYEGKAPELETANHKEVIKVEPKSPKLGKELQVEVKETTSGTEYEVIVFNESSVELGRAGPFKEASKLIGLTSVPGVTFAKGTNYSAGEKEKLTTSAKKWLDEKCNKTENDKFNSTSSVRECEYTDEAGQCDAPNSTKDLTEPIIYAGILAVKQSFIVDNFICGKSELGHLNIYGAVAGLYTNGFTGEFNGSSGVIEHGYPYNANYDNRLQVAEPPHFLNPIEAAWFIQRQTLVPNP